MTATDVIKMLLEMDQQMLSGRPSVLGRAAEIVQQLCRHAEGSLRDPDLLGDYESIDLAPARSKLVSRELRQTTLDLAEENDRLRDELERWELKDELRPWAPRTIVRRPGGKWDLFDDDADATRLCAEAKAGGELAESWDISEWHWHLRGR